METIRIAGVRICEGCCGPLGPFDALWEVCLPCTKARHKAAITKRCVCGTKRRPTDVKRIGSRLWVSCKRCLGTIKQLS